MDRAINTVIRITRRALTGQRRTDPLPFARVSKAYQSSCQLIRIYYVISIYVCYNLLVRFDRLAEEAGAWHLLWPLAWAANLEPQTTVRALGIASFIAALLAARFSASRLARMLFALAFLGLAAVPNSLGAVNHGYHAWFWIGFCLILLPASYQISPSRSVKMATLRVILTTQALLLMFYSLSGIWKLLEGVSAWTQGLEGNLSYLGFSRVLANRAVETGTSPLLADLFISNPWLAWPCFIFVIYVQVVSIFIAFRPSLHVAWGYLLILFHFGTWLLMAIPFPLHVLFLALFLVLSPFRPETAPRYPPIRDMPIIGKLIWLGRMKSAP